MDSCLSSPHHLTQRNTIEDLPDEVIEFILGFLPPYKDLQDCMCVCRRWYVCAKSVMRKATFNLQKAIAEFDIQWKNMTPAEMAPTITKRFSHAACVHENSMYVFGGCTTNSTAFNDLWRFDLSKRQWIRPLAMGTYPAPKAYASMIKYQNNLILFGGWTYPSRSSFYQDWKIFSEMHSYNIKKNRWILMNTTNIPPPMAGHSAMIHDNCMIVFGGLYKPLNTHQISCSNDVWVLDLISLEWRKQPTTNPKPQPRYGQSLIELKSNSFMILGGVKAFQTRSAFNDCWILIMEGPVWTWKEITIKHKEWSASNIWCNPACKVGDKVVSLSHDHNGIRHPVTSAVRIGVRERDPAPSLSHRIEQSARRPIDHDQNINGKRGALPHRKPNVEKANDFKNRLSSDDEIDQSPGPSNVDKKNSSHSKENNDNDLVSTSAAEHVSSKTIDDKRILQIDNKPSGKNSTNGKHKLKNATSISNKSKGVKLVRHLNNTNGFRMAAFQGLSQDIPQENEAIDDHDNNAYNDVHQPQVHIMQDIPPVPQPTVKRLRRNTLSLHVLDISNIMNDVSNASVSWLCPRQKEINGAPEELVMYTLVRGKGELIMFGGVHNDVFVPNCTTSRLYSNSLYFILPPKDII